MPGNCLTRLDADYSQNGAVYRVLVFHDGPHTAAADRLHVPWKKQGEGLLYNTTIALIYNRFAGMLIDLDVDFIEDMFRAAIGDSIESVTFMRFDGNQVSGIKTRLEAMKPDTVWVAGGDGTVISVAAIASSLGVPLGIIPAGTMNLLARDLGMSLDLAAAINQLKGAKPECIDMVNLNDRFFLCISNIGISTRLTEKREMLRHATALVRWPLVLWYIVKSLFVYPSLYVKLQTGRNVYNLRTRSITITNNPLIDDSAFLPSRADINHGMLGGYVARDTSLWSLPRLMFKLLVGRWKQDRDLWTFRSPEVVISSRHKRQIRVMADGELHKLRLPLIYKSMPCALDVLKPVSKS